jgi:hypothetical protein
VLFRRHGFAGSSYHTKDLQVFPLRSYGHKFWKVSV